MSLAIITHYGPLFLEGRNGAMPRSHIDSAIKWMLLQSWGLYIYVFWLFYSPLQLSDEAAGCSRKANSTTFPHQSREQVSDEGPGSSEPAQFSHYLYVPNNAGTNKLCMLTELLACVFVPLYWVLHKGGVNKRIWFM